MLKLRDRDLQAMQTHAEQAYPEECCGLLLGRQQGDLKILFDLLPVKNSWQDESPEILQEIDDTVCWRGSKRDRFAIAPEEMLRAQKQARDRDLIIVGIYHSHPDHAAIPSECDRAIAWPQYSYIIISVQQGIARDLRNWSLDEAHHFQPEKILKIKATSPADE